MRNEEKRAKVSGKRQKINRRANEKSSMIAREKGKNSKDKTSGKGEECPQALDSNEGKTHLCSVSTEEKKPPDGLTEKPANDSQPLPLLLSVDLPTDSPKTRERGRPRVETPEAPDLQILSRYAAAGLSEAQLCYMLDIDRKRLQRWKRLSDVKRALKEGRKRAVEHAETALYLKAVGFWHDGQRIDKSGNVVSIKEYEPPDGDALKFYLANRAPDQWKLRTVAEVSGTTRTEYVNIPSSHEERVRLAAEIQQKLAAAAGRDASTLALDGGRQAPAVYVETGPESTKAEK